MAPARIAKEAPSRVSKKSSAMASLGIGTGIGMATRSRSNGAKRKADSPPKGAVANVKRAAFGDITNAIVRVSKNLNDDAKATLLKVTKKKTKTDTVSQNKRRPLAAIEKPAKIVENAVGEKLNDHPFPIKRTEPLRKIDPLEKISIVSGVGERFDDTSLYVSAVEDISDDSCGKSEKEPSLARDINLLAIDDKENSVPEGVNDFDKENWNDPFQVSTYAMDIFEYLKSRESLYVIGNYLSHQKELTGWMRSLLVDWMVEVQESFELNHETLYLAVKLVDLFLSKKPIKKDELQLLGSASLFIASKYDERIPPLVDDFLYICDGAYTLRQLLAMEINILKTVDFNLGIPLSYRFLRRYARCARVSMPTLTLARFILESCLMEYSLISFSDSLMAAAALYLAIRMKNLGTWTKTHIYYTGYSLKQILLVAKLQNVHLHKKPKEGLSTVRNKYSHKIFFEVAKTPLISDDDLT